MPELPSNYTITEMVYNAPLWVYAARKIKEKKSKQIKQHRLAVFGVEIFSFPKLLEFICKDNLIYFHLHHCTTHMLYIHSI